MACNQNTSCFSRRDALSRVAGGFGMVAFANMISSSIARAAETSSKGTPGALKQLDFKPRAKRVIFLFMNGGLSHVDTFDPKPMLDKYDGHPLPGPPVATPGKTGNLMRSPFKFEKYGPAGIEMSELWPHLGGVSEHMCVIRSMYSDIPNHEPSITMMNTGANVVGRPSLGAWITYGLGITNENLPGYVVLSPSQPITIGSPLWSSGFLPAIHQGTYVKNEWQAGEAFDPERVIPNIKNAVLDSGTQRENVDLLRKLNEMHLAKTHEQDSQLEASIKTMETAFQMQTAAPDVFNIGKESKAVLDMYGSGSTALGCLMAVRLAEQGVRITQVYYSKGDPWDAHNDIQSYRKLARDSDQPFAAAIRDLEQRGMLEDTLVIGGTEFGRTPVIQTSNEAVGGVVVNGRDHNAYGFSVWLAGGGVKGGMTYGATDDFGFKAVDKKTHVHDLHATILYLLGIDHKKLTYRYSGRDFRLTDTAGEVIHDIIA